MAHSSGCACDDCLPPVILVGNNMCPNCKSYILAHSGTHAPNCCCPDCPDNEEVDPPSAALKKIELNYDDFLGYPKWNVGTDVGINPSLKPAVNDHVCPKCKNNRLSKTEVKCWSCGEKLL